MKRLRPVRKIHLNELAEARRWAAKHPTADPARLHKPWAWRFSALAQQARICAAQLMLLS